MSETGESTEVTRSAYDVVCVMWNRPCSLAGTAPIVQRPEFLKLYSCCREEDKEFKFGNSETFTFYILNESSTFRSILSLTSIENEVDITPTPRCNCEIFGREKGARCNENSKVNW